jgi:hypothetical protein
VKALHPNQFEVNEAWIAFRLNQSPIQTETEGSFDCYALMDAASCFILGAELVPIGKSEPSTMEWRRLLKKGRSHKHQWPRTLMAAREDVVESLSSEAARLKVGMVRVAEEDLLVFIEEARDGFEEHLGDGARRA